MGAEHAMKARPILFSAPMILALLDSRKTQTRRLVKPQPNPCKTVNCSAATWSPSGGWHCTTCGNGIRGAEHNYTGLPCPYGVPGDVLWAREAWRIHERFPDVARVRYQASERRSWTEQHEDFPVHLAAGLKDKAGYRPSIHMPRWANRLTLEITDVRVERLQSISEIDAIAEGITVLCPPDRDGRRHFGLPGFEIDEPTAARAYSKLWAMIHGPGSWISNPWVWAVTAPPIQQNVDAFMAPQEVS